MYIILYWWCSAPHHPTAKRFISKLLCVICKCAHASPFSKAFDLFCEKVVRQLCERRSVTANQCWFSARCFRDAWMAQRTSIDPGNTTKMDLGMWLVNIGLVSPVLLSILKRRQTKEQNIEYIEALLKWEIMVYRFRAWKHLPADFKKEESTATRHDRRRMALS